MFHWFLKTPFAFFQICQLSMLWVILLALSKPLHASPNNILLTLTPDCEERPIRNVEILVDQADTMTFEDVLLSDRLFFHSSGKVPNFGFTSSAVWLRFRLHNCHPSHKEWLLEIAYPLLDELTLYVKNDQQEWTKRLSGSQHPYQAREIAHRFFIFRLDLPPGETTECYLKVRSESSVQIPLTVYSVNRFVSSIAGDQFIYGGFYGILLLMMLYNLIFFISIRDKSYLYYVFYICFYMIGQMGIDGYAYEFLWRDLPEWNKLTILWAMSLALFWCSQFSRTFLRSGDLTPRMNWLISVYMGAVLLTFIASFVASYSVIISIIAILSVILSFILIPAGILSWRQRYRPAGYFLAGWTAYFIGVSLFAFKSLGFFPYSFITQYGVQIGAIIQVTLLSLGLANRYQLLRQELAEQRLQREILERKQEAERKALIEKQKSELEIQVAEQTRNLSEKTEELEKINRIVKAINSEIDFSSLLETLLKETNLISVVHRACILAIDREAEQYKVKMTRGWSAPGLAAVSITPEKAESLFIRPAESPYEDIYKIHTSPEHNVLPSHDFFGNSASRVVLQIRTGSMIGGYIIFDHLESETAFDKTHLHFLSCLKEHITSAFIKIKLLEELKTLNVQKNEFLGIAAHDLRSPLGAVIGFVELVLEDIRNDRFNKEEVISDLSIVLKSSRDMVQLISDLLDISAIETGKVSLELHRENLVTILEECEKMNRKAAAVKNITLEIEKPSHLPPLMIDKIRILEVMNNLISNAIKYTYPGGHIHVFCEEKPSLIVTHVRDTGQGLSETDLQHIFTGYKKLSSRPTAGETSTGFGLAIVKKIVELHHGRIWVTSKLGEGSTFSFSLPVVA